VGRAVPAGVHRLCLDVEKGILEGRSLVSVRTRADGAGDVTEWESST
jgi:hypothetical protein